MLPTAFDAWLAETFAREGPFTMFLVLFEQAPDTIVPIGSSYLHVVGDDVAWVALAEMIGASGLAWDSVAIFAGKATAGGPMPDGEAKGRLASLERAVIRDRMNVHKGELYDRLGRRLALEPVSRH